MTGTRRLTVVLALLAGLIGASLPADAASLSGYDISWPQCPGGLPLPPPSTSFAIVGLTRGLPFTENPCLQDQLGWARSNGVPAQAYTIAAYPTADQLSRYGGQGPWSASTRSGQLSNVGYAEAGFATASLRSTSFQPPVVWIDVEPRPAQEWPVATSGQRRENRSVVEGLMRGLYDAGIPYGLYSNAGGWSSITDSWWLPGIPVWATAGRLDYPTEAQDRCVQPSFSGGRVYVSQWTDGTYDYDLTCGSYQFTPLPMPPTSARDIGSFNGDWGSDLLARERATGSLWLYPTTGRGTTVSWSTASVVGIGWNVMNALVGPGDVNGDGTRDVLAREASTGDLWLYPGNGADGWLPRVRVGVGWNVMNALVGPGDVTGDQRVDLLAREASTGDLWLYPGNGAGGWLPRVRVGVGWNVMNVLVGPGDLTGDGAADLLAREASTGDLWLYPGTGAGGWLPPVRVGVGWNGMTALAAVGDLDQDRTPDLLARDGPGNLWLYPGNGTGGWLPRRLVGVGWNVHDVLF